MDVSIVIVSFNTRKLLDDCIQSIKKETVCCYEIIVVDNASTDGSCAMLREKHNDVTIVENNVNAGFAKANNQGFTTARGKYFLMLNPDTVVLNSAIDKLFEFMERNQDVGICGPRNIDADGKLQYNCDHFPSVWNTLCYYTNLSSLFHRSSLFNRCWMGYWDYNEIRDVERIVGCSLMIRATLYKELKGLNEDYFMYFEETEFCLRASEKGQRVSYFPCATVLHYGGGSNSIKSSEKMNTTILSYYFDSQYYFYERNFGLIAMHAVRSLDLLYGLFLLIRSLMCPDSEKRCRNKDYGRFLIKKAYRRIQA